MNMPSAAQLNGWHESVKPQPKYAHESLNFEKRLQPKSYTIAGTSPASKILILNVKIIDSTGRQPYVGDVYIEGERFVAVGFVPNIAEVKNKVGVRVVDGRKRTLMSSLGDAHTHLTWNNNALDMLGNVGVEEHVLITAKSALTYLDSGYTMCYGAASAKDRLDCVIRDAINKGDIPGPRYLANGREIARRDGELAAGITAFADGPLEMREVIRHHARVGVDQIKLSMSGEAITETRSAEECFYTDEETAACVDEAHRHGLRVCAHARARDSVIQCARHGVDVIYHASYTDDIGMDLLVKNKDKLVVAPAINWLWATVHDAEPFGYTLQKAEQVGYTQELEVATRVLKEMHNRGVTVLPGGDYGFAWCPHGTYARDLEHFVKLLDFTPMESIVAATAGVAKLFMQEHELGKILPGYYADCIIIDGDPLDEIGVLQKHDKLNVIMINGRLHKSSTSDFVLSQGNAPKPAEYHNFVVYEDELGRSNVGHLDLKNKTVQKLAMSSGSPLSTINEVIALENDVMITDEVFPLASVKLLPPIGDRDILCVGNNYVEHIEEFQSSDFAAETNLVVFTNRKSSVVAADEDIYAHPDFTSTLDYEGEVGVIIGKSGFAISEADAMNYVWGYTIINDISARGKQRDHGQFLVGKSPDTFCPMGPIALPASAAPATFDIQTFVNGEKRQSGGTDLLRISIPKLIEIISRAMTLQAGDVIATGTPAGVSAGMKPPEFLKPGDLVEVSVTGLGKLSNRVSDKKTPVKSKSILPVMNLERSWGGVGLTKINDKLINIRETGAGSQTLVFIHGLGASLEYYEPLIQALDLQSRFRIISYDLEGHGHTPTAAASTITLESYASDLRAIFEVKKINRAIVIGWSLGGLIAMLFATQNSKLVEKMVLLGPGPSPFPEAAVDTFTQRALLARSRGLEISGIAKTVATAATSKKTQDQRPVIFSAVRQYLLSTSPEGYAKGCMALVKSRNTTIDIENIHAPVLLVAGKDDKIAPLSLAEVYVKRLPNAKLEVVGDVGHWHITEDLSATAGAIARFL